MVVIVFARAARIQCKALNQLNCGRHSLSAGLSGCRRLNLYVIGYQIMPIRRAGPTVEHFT